MKNVGGGFRVDVSERGIKVIVKKKCKKGQWGGRGGGTRFEPKTLSSYLAFILFEILLLQNCDVKFQNFQRVITKKNYLNFFLNFTR